MVESIGKNVNIEKGAVISCKVIIGDNSGIGVNCSIPDCVTIGDNVMMGPDCLLYTRNHKFDKKQGKYIGYTEYSPITIDDNVWLGARCIILPGVNIGKGSTIGAGSVVTRSVPAYSVAVGNPVRIIKNLLG
jgi:acetyltransferase-like isoleucine patch superfamily enzyme